MTADVDLVAGIRAGQTAAFEAPYEKYKTQICGTALAMTGDHHTAEEVLQDTFVQPFVHADTADGGMSLAPWLQRIAINLSANRRARKRLLPVFLGSFAEHIFATDDQSPERLAERSQPPVRPDVEAPAVYPASTETTRGPRIGFVPETPVSPAGCVRPSCRSQPYHPAPFS